MAVCSGTTGDPKGVLITHKNVVAGIAAAVKFVNFVGLDITQADSTLSYLPLAHILTASWRSLPSPWEPPSGTTRCEPFSNPCRLPHPFVWCVAQEIGL